MIRTRLDTDRGEEKGRLGWLEPWCGGNREGGEDVFQEEAVCTFPGSLVLLHFLVTLERPGEKNFIKFTHKLSPVFLFMVPKFPNSAFPLGLQLGQVNEELSEPYLSRNWLSDNLSYLEHSPQQLETVFIFVLLDSC